MTILNELKQREAIAEITNERELEDLLENESIVVYCGIDPTAGSAHVGHLCPFILLRRLQDAGHTPTVLVGEFTASCGDPSFKAQERDKISLDTINSWASKLTQQLKTIIRFDGPNAARLVNNKDWFSQMSLQTFLRYVGQHFSVNTMIKKASVKERLEREGQGISFTEFSYSLLQGYDFAHLSQQGVMLQIGGNDQMGNIISGIDLTRRLHGIQVFGMTMPLMVKADGTKFGKTESGTIWLDPERTSPYAFYQFWLNTTDDDVEKFLKIYTFLSLEEIARLMEQHNETPHKHEAQKVLAQEVTKFIHGEVALQSAIQLSEILFSGRVNEMTNEDFKQLESSSINLVSRRDTSNSLVQCLVDCGLAESRSKARYLISANAVTVNEKKVTETDYLLNESDSLFGKYSIIRRGKKHFAMIH